MTIGIEVGLVIIGNAIIVGVAWGNLAANIRQNRREIGVVKKALGLENGGEGAFTRRTECAIIEHSVTRQLAEMRSEITALADRLNRP